MISVIGATGNVGRELVEQLCHAGQPVRVVTRDGRNVAQLDGRVDVVVGDLRDSRIVARALEGAERLFWLSIIDVERPLDDRAFLDEAQRAGVRHIVKLSTIGATSTIPIGRYHREREEWIEQSGLAWTFLRPGFFMSNVLRWATSIKTEGRVCTPIPEGQASPIAPRDIAEIATLALVTPGHEGKIYELTGADLLSASEQVEILSRLIGKPIACVATPIEAAADNLRRAGQTEWMIESLVEMWKDVRSGKGRWRTETFAELTGHAPQTFDEWCRAHRSAFV
jgi:uncharacterized protein YbjT (DUF2867 family)